MEQLRGDNMTSGTLGFGSDAIPITTPANTGPDTTFGYEEDPGQVTRPQYTASQKHFYAS